MVSTLLNSRLHQYAYRTGEFTLSSGERSSEYLDVRSAILNPRVNRLLISTIESHIIAQPALDAIAGVLFGGAMLAQLLGYTLHKPVLAVRTVAKQHGLSQLVEGALNLPNGGRDASVFLLEDVITSGNSVLQALRVLGEQGVVVKRVIAVVNREQGGLEAIAKEYPAIPVLALTTLAAVRTPPLEKPQPV